MNNNFKRMHPYFIIYSTFKFLAVILLPFITALIEFINSGFKVFPSLEGKMYASLMAIILLGVINWLTTSYEDIGDFIVYNSGIFYKNNAVIPKNKIITVVTERTPICRAVGAVKFYMDTLSGKSREFDFLFILSENAAAKIIESKTVGNITAIKKSYKPYIGDTALLALFTSNSLGGIVLVVTAISNIGKVAGRALTKRIFGAVAEIIKRLAFGIPVMAAYIGYTIVLGWIIVFVKNVLAHHNFKVTRQNGHLEIQSGFLTLSRNVVDVNYIDAIEIRHTITSKIFKVCTVFLHATGYGKANNNLGVVMPALKDKDCENIIKTFFDKRPSKNNVNVSKKCWYRFLMFPLIYILVWVAAAAVAWIYFKPIRDFLFAILLLAVGPVIWSFVISLFDFFTGGVAKDENLYTLRYGSLFNLQTVIINEEKVVKKAVIQSAYQLANDLCDLKVYESSEKEKSYTIKALPLSELKAAGIV